MLIMNEIWDILYGDVHQTWFIVLNGTSFLMSVVTNVTMMRTFEVRIVRIGTSGNVYTNVSPHC